MSCRLNHPNAASAAGIKALKANGFHAGTQTCWRCVQAARIVSLLSSSKVVRPAAPISSAAWRIHTEG